MESGFQTIVGASATLLGLVLVALVFSYRSAITLIEKIGDFRHFARWVWTSGFCCFLYFSCCLLTGFRLMEDETSRLVLAIIFAFFSGILLVMHVLEVLWLGEMARGRWGEFRVIFLIQAVLAAIMYLFFLILVWRAFSFSTLHEFERDIFAALTYTLFFAAFRAVVLVGLSFWSITLLGAKRPEPEEAKAAAPDEV